MDNKFLILILGLSLSACSGSIHGQAYYDENDNGTIDSNEKAASAVEMTITKDGQKIAQETTDDNGEFIIQSEGTGYYCFSPNVKNITTETTGTSKSMSFGDATPATGTLAQSTATPAASGTALNTGPDSTTTKPTPVGPTGWTDKGWCQQLQNRGGEVSMGIKIDFESSLASLPDPTEEKLKIGEVRTLKIFVPSGCRLKQLFLPRCVVADTGSHTFDSDLNMVTFSENASMETKAVDGTNLPGSGFDIAALPIQAVDDENITADGSETCTVKPKAICGSKNITLKEIPLKIVRVTSVVLNLGLLNKPALGDIATVEALVENKSSISIAGEVKVDAGNLPVESAEAKDSTCHLLGTGAKCEVSLPANSKKYCDIVIRMPDAVDKDTKFPIEAKFSSDTLKEPIEADAVEILLKKPSADTQTPAPDSTADDAAANK